MRLVLAVLLIFYTLSLPARAQEPPTVDGKGCTLSLEAIKPIMTITDDLKPSYSATLDKTTRMITEHVTLANGLKITYTVGGCEHYAVTYLFEDIPMDMTLGREPHELAVELLNHVPGVEHNFLADFFEDAIYDQTPVDDAGGFNCGDAYCIMRRNGQTVDIEYDFAL